MDLYFVHKDGLPETQVQAMDAEQAAELYCEQLHSSEGWEWTWPAKIIVENMGKRIWQFTVERESLPVFSVVDSEELT